MCCYSTKVAGSFYNVEKFVHVTRHVHFSVVGYLLKYDKGYLRELLLMLQYDDGCSVYLWIVYFGSSSKVHKQSDVHLERVLLSGFPL